MSPEIKLTAEMVDKARRDVCLDAPSGYQWGRGEFNNSIFEALVYSFELPWKRLDIGEVPDFDDVRVRRLSRELEKFQDVIAKGCRS